MFEEEGIKKNLGITLKNLRESKGLTQEQLAEYVDMQPSTIRGIEKGRYFVSGDSLARLSNYFEVDPSIFFTKKVSVISEEKVDYISEIKRQLPLFSSSKLKEILDILLVMHKQ